MDTNTSTETTDPRPLLRAAFDQIERLLAATTSEDLTRPTPCTEWDVATLIAHLGGVALRVGGGLRREPLAELPRFVEPRDLAGLRAAWQTERARTEESLADDALLEGEIERPFGMVPAPAALAAFVGELATHAWDLAVAIDRTDLLEDELAVHGLEPSRRFIPAHIREMEAVPFEAVVEVAEDAGAYERLAAWAGRDPQWAP